MAEDLYCICRGPYDYSQFMIQCDACDDWFHGSCVGVEEYQANDIERYHCPRCIPRFGPMTLKKHQNFHRHDYSDQKAHTKAVQSGTPVFIKQLKSKQFSSPENILIKCNGKELNQDYLSKKGFQKPILVQNKNGLGMIVPDSSFSVADVQKFVGPATELDIIDVTKQDDLKMKMCEWTSYFQSSRRQKTLNVISLEFSRTSLSQVVHAPKFVRDVDWVNRYWPEHPPDDIPHHPRPFVQKYCLMGVKDSYTDFHVDFGGSSVWYHVLWGEKIFYFAEPTETNLKLYEKWVSSSNQSEMFFADLITRCYKICVKPGQTLFIPTGWIHAVYTPVDTLVFGGNFLHSYNIGLQLSIYDMELRLKTPSKYLFTYFETVHWYAAVGLIDELKNLGDCGEKWPQFMIDGVHALLETLKNWIMKKGGSFDRHKIYIPEGLEHNKVIKSLSKELKVAEKPIVVVHDQKPVIKIKNPIANQSKRSNEAQGNAIERAVLKNTKKKSVVPAITAPLRLKISKNNNNNSSSQESDLSDGHSLSPPATNFKLFVSNGRITSGSGKRNQTEMKEDTSRNAQYSCQHSQEKPLKLRLSMNGKDSPDSDSDVNIDLKISKNGRQNTTQKPKKPQSTTARSKRTAIPKPQTHGQTTASIQKTTSSKRNPPLSISSPSYSESEEQSPSKTFTNSDDGGRRSRLNSPLDDDGIEEELEQYPSDPDFVYPTIEDDEAKSTWKPGMKKNKNERVDATWNPGSRVTQSKVQNTSRPVRTVSRKPEFELLNPPKNNNTEVVAPEKKSNQTSSKSQKRAPLRTSGNQSDHDKGQASKRGKRSLQMTTKQRLAKKLKMDKGSMFLR